MVRGVAGVAERADYAKREAIELMKILLVFLGNEPLQPISVNYAVYTRAEMRELYVTSRAVLFTSIWETGPIAVGEALASGCSLVGVPLMNFLTYHLVGPYGRCAPDRNPQRLADAMAAEMHSWDAGERRPEEIARFWRARLNARTVCGELLATVDIGQPAQNASE